MLTEHNNLRNNIFDPFFRSRCFEPVALRYQTASSGANVIYQEPRQARLFHYQAELYWLRGIMPCQPHGISHVYCSFGI